MLRAPAALIALLLAAATGVEGSVRRVELEPGTVAAFSARRDLYLEALPEAGEGWLAFARRFTGSSQLASDVIAANGGERRLLAGIRYRVPFSLLRPEYQLRVVRAVFEGDEVEASGWRHRVAPAGGDGLESLWSIAEWFTGRGDNYRAIRDHNGLADDDLRPGQVLVIPARLLRPALRGALPPSSPYYLQYDQDGAGDFAIYRLKEGEALYSSVVIRFTGRVFADDVKALADEIAARSGIRDVTQIPVDYRVKIPFDLLLPEFLPASDERRQEYERGLMASARFSNPVMAASLEGITVVLDSGHGGVDVGASLGGVWESLYVYDIMVRTRLLLESTTAARVWSLTRDGREYQVADRDRLPYSRDHRVLTTPHYPIEDSTTGLHLRWYLANSLFRRAVDGDGDGAKVVFLSIHADSLHPSLRGAMAYVPGAGYRAGSYGKTGAVYASRQEYREKPRVAFSSRERVRSEGLSRELARRVIEAFARKNLHVHPDRAIRDKVIRKRRAWVPAILRYNEIPAQILLEVCNLANDHDRELLQTRAFRQRVAEAIVEGIVDYYDDSKRPPGVQVAASGS